MAYLLVKSGELVGLKFELDKDRVLIGRSQDADFQVAHAVVSSQHAEIVEDNGRHLINDLGSTNGTVVNGRKIGSESVLLDDGVLIDLANQTIRIEYVADEQNDQTVVMTPGHAMPARGMFRVDEGSRDVCLGEEVLKRPLSKRLFDVLNLLYKHEGNVCSTEAIKRIGWPDRPQGGVSTNELYVMMRRLRLGLRRLAPEHELIQNVQGIGYKLVLPPEMKGG